jgi:hypothetical protein
VLNDALWQALEVLMPPHLPSHCVLALDTQQLEVDYDKGGAG